MLHSCRSRGVHVGQELRHSCRSLVVRVGQKLAVPGHTLEQPRQRSGYAGRGCVSYGFFFVITMPTPNTPRPGRIKSVALYVSNAKMPASVPPGNNGLMKILITPMMAQMTPMIISNNPIYILLTFTVAHSDLKQNENWWLCRERVCT